MLRLEALRQSDIDEITEAFAAIGWNKPPALLEKYLADCESGLRSAIVARWSDDFAGYVTLCWQSPYAPFQELGIPEVQDLNVLPRFRRRHIATRLLDAAEALAAERSSIVGIGVALDAAYGPAQRLYGQRGYIPDGRGAESHGLPLAWGQSVTADDELVLHLTKTAAGNGRPD